MINQATVRNVHNNIICFSRLKCTNQSHFPHSMSVTQAMEWLIEHVDDPTVDMPLPGQEAQGAAGSTGPASASASASVGPSPSSRGIQAAISSQSSSEEAKQDELTEIFKRIRRKREFRPDSRVSAVVHKRLGFNFSKSLISSCLNLASMFCL